MTDAMCHIERSKESNQRLMYFSKNRDCDKDFDLYFTIQKDSIHYSYETIKED
jgi:hypothetical protein